MSRRLVATLFALTLSAGLAAADPAHPASAADALDSDDFGRYQVLRSEGAVARLVFAIGADGDAALGAAAAALTRHGALVARIDVDRFAAGVRDRGDACLDLSAIVNWHANDLGRRYGLSRLEPPLLVGRGSGAALVQVLLAQAPPQTFAGGVVEPPPPGLALPFAKPLCGLAAAHGGDPVREPAPPPLGAPWWVIAAQGREPPLPDAAARAELLRPLATADLAQGATRALDELAATQRPTLRALADIPLVEVPAPAPNDALAVIYSGDGGWRDIDKTLGDLLAQSGVPVVGVDAVRYFWHRKAPQQVADDLLRILDHYAAAWGSRRVLLIGYSFGADILPATYNRLPAAARQRVAGLALLAPARSADFEVKIAGWLGKSSADAAPTLPELRHIDPSRVLCIYGSEELNDSLCTAPGSGDLIRLQRPGGHHFDGDYEFIARAILAFFDARQAAGTERPPPES